MGRDSLVRGMGSFFKECGHTRSRWSKCPHSYKIRYRSAAGRQVEESGFATPGEGHRAFDGGLQRQEASRAPQPDEGGADRGLWGDAVR